MGPCGWPCAKNFNWTRHRTAEHTVKRHLQLDHDGLRQHCTAMGDGKTAMGDGKMLEIAADDNLNRKPTLRAERSRPGGAFRHGIAADLNSSEMARAIDANSRNGVVPGVGLEPTLLLRENGF